MVGNESKGMKVQDNTVIKAKHCIISDKQKQVHPKGIGFVKVEGCPECKDNFKGYHE